MSRKVLFLSPGMFDKGGISRYCRYQVRALRELLGSDAVEVFSLLPPDEQAFEEPFGVNFASVGPTGRGKLLFSIAAILAAIDPRPSVVWCAHVHLAPLAAVLAAAVRARFILNVYGAEVWTDLNPIRQRAIRRADVLISDCHATLDHVVGSGLHEPCQTFVHWDCVDVDRFVPGPPSNVLARLGVEPAPGWTTVLTLARLARSEGHKGVDRLIEVVRRLAAEPIRLVVAGDGDWRPDLEEMARRAGVSERVRFVGRVAEADLADVYRSCDIFSLVTDKRPGGGEGLPLTPIEAAACGKPIIVGNQDGSIEAVDDGLSGYALNPFDLVAIVEAVRRLAGEEALRRAMGMRGREKIVREMSYERFRGRLAELIAVARI